MYDVLVDGFDVTAKTMVPRQWRMIRNLEPAILKIGAPAYSAIYFRGEDGWPFPP